MYKRKDYGILTANNRYFYASDENVMEEYEMETTNEIIDSYRKFAITAEKELFYPKAIILRLKAAKTENEITRIMKTAREGML